MCTRNGERFLTQQLHSIGAQSRRPEELVISDDASTDASVSLLESFASAAPFPVKVTVNERRLNSTANYESVIQRCTGDIIVLADQDDVWLPHKLEAIEDAFTGEAWPSGPRLVFSDAYLIDEDGRRSGRRLWSVAGFDGHQQKKMRRDPFGQIMGRSIVSGCTLAFRADALAMLLPFPPQSLSPTLRLIHDRWISLVLAAAGGVVLVDEPLIEYRLHRRQQIGIPGLQVRQVVPSSLLRWRQVAVPRAVSAERLRATLGLVEEIARRLGQAMPADELQPCLTRIDDAAAHLRVRAGLPAARYRRLLPIALEARYGRYHRYSLGFASAGADLVR